MGLKLYYQLAKPGIVYGNLISAIAGFLFASHLHVRIIPFFAMIVGVSFVIGASCVVNNLIDRSIDAKMGRTSKRSLVTKKISARNAIMYAVILDIVGLVTLLVLVNTLTAILGILGMFFYLVVYSIAKRTTIYSTLIGTISGAIPILAGYTAVSNKIDIPGIILFLILVFWQMPHFYSIALYRKSDYANAGLMVWPVKKSEKNTKMQIIIYSIIFVIISLLLAILGYANMVYLVIMLVLGLLWIYMGIEGFGNNAMWSRKMFFFSLIALLVTSVAISIASLGKTF